MRELAVIETFRRKWLQSGSCPVANTAKHVTDAEEVRISDMLGVFVILGFTVGVSLLIALVELLWWRRRKQKIVISDSEQVPSQVSQNL